MLRYFSSRSGGSAGSGNIAISVQDWARNRAFSLTWPASMQIYGYKRKRLQKKRVHLPQSWFGTPTWPAVTSCENALLWKRNYHISLIRMKCFEFMRICHILVESLHSQLAVEPTWLPWVTILFCKNVLFVGHSVRRWSLVAMFRYIVFHR